MTPATLLISVVMFSVMTATVLAATPKPTPGTSPSPTPQTASDSAMINIKQRVEMVKQTTDPQVKGMMTALKQVKFGIIGTLDKIVGSTLQIQTPRGVIRLAELDRTAVVLKGSKPIAHEDIELNIPVIAMGFVQKDGSLLVRRLILSDDSLFGIKQAAIYGKVQSMTTKALNVNGFQNGQPTIISIKFGTRTSYLNTLGNTIKRTDIKPQDPVIAVFSDEVATASAARIYSLSPAAIPTPSVVPVPGI